MEAIIIIVASVIIITVIVLYNKKIDRLQDKAYRDSYDKQNIINDLTKKVENLQEDKDFLEEGFRKKDELYHDFKNHDNESAAKIKSLYNDYLLLQYEITEKYLRTKKHPAYVKARSVKELKLATQKYLEELNELRYKFDLIARAFPELPKYIQDFDSIKAIESDYSLKTFTEIDDLKKKIKEMESIISTKDREKNGLLNKIGKLEADHMFEIKQLKFGMKRKDVLYKELKEGNNSVSKISSLYSDFLLLEFDLSEKYLRRKQSPAIKEAKRIRDLKKESKLHIEKYRQMVYKYEFLLQLFPELTNYVEDFESIRQLENYGTLQSFKEDFDRVQFYISKEEYADLTTDERNQLALDRYVKGKKTKWQIGRDYELFCGQYYEKNGWDVEYIGMERKLNDMGRDLIAKKSKQHYVIQCKYWASEKIIHEKHITQLFGSTIEYSMDISDEIDVMPVFVTNIKLTETAMRFANKLGVIVLENFSMNEFPRIKCNINIDENGDLSKIYHLPFDQQYDRTKINKKGEFYAFTVKEAVLAGFRRALRYFGHDN